MNTATRRLRPSRTAAAVALLCGLLATGPVPAASATGQASAAVVLPVPVNAWLGTPVSVQDLLLAQDAPAGPATGSLVPQVPAVAAPLQTRMPPAWIADVLDGRAAFSIDMVPGAGLLPQGPAASISAAAHSDGQTPLTITVAFN